MSEEIATLGGGCFWCLEAVYKDLRGVRGVMSGYAGGPVANPSYKAVCAGTTGHAEVVQIEYDPDEVSYADRLRVLLQQKLSDGADVATGLLAAVAAYFPLHAIPKAETLLGREWPDYASGLIRQQLKEPLEEIADRAAIPALTAIEGGSRFCSIPSRST